MVDFLGIFFRRAAVLLCGIDLQVIAQCTVTECLPYLGTWVGMQEL